MIGQPIEIATGPPLFQACPKVVKQPDRTEMMEKETAKLENPLQRRLNSCLYPRDSSKRDSESLLRLIYYPSFCVAGGENQLMP